MSVATLFGNCSIIMDIAEVSEAAPPMAAVALNKKHKTTNKVWSEILPQNLKNSMN